MFRRIITRLGEIWKGRSTRKNIGKGGTGISQNNNKVGGDMIAVVTENNITFNIVMFFEDYRHSNYHLNDDQVEQISKILRHLGKSEGFASGAFKPMTYNEFSDSISNAAKYRIQQKQFGAAHKLYADVLENSNIENYNSYFKQFLITGFIHYSQKNDMDGLRNLLDKINAFHGIKDAEIDIIASNIFQEICSRDSSLADLTSYMSELESLYNNASISVKSSMANSLGLAYRRLGERTGVDFLRRAIPVFDNGLKFNNGNLRMEVDLKDQKAITYIRIFEFDKDSANLDEAERLLRECVSVFTSIDDFRGERLKPRILNNLGNVYKQKALCIDNGANETNAANAIEQYNEAEKYWDKENAKYEWALLQKNKAEAKYAIAKVSHDRRLLIEALEDCINSIEFRTFENSPYQWQKSVIIILKIVQLLNTLNDLKLIPLNLIEQIRACLKLIDENHAIWDEEKANSFIIAAKQVSTLLNTNAS